MQARFASGKPGTTAPNRSMKKPGLIFQPGPMKPMKKPGQLLGGCLGFAVCRFQLFSKNFDCRC